MMGLSFRSVLPIAAMALLLAGCQGILIPGAPPPPQAASLAAVPGTATPSGGLADSWATPVAMPVIAAPAPVVPEPPAPVLPEAPAPQGMAAAPAMAPPAAPETHEHEDTGTYGLGDLSAAGRGLVPGSGLKLSSSTLDAAGQRVVALTFDDGPDVRHTRAVAKVLEAHGVKGTFFVIGTQMKDWPGQVAELAAAGHEIGAHSEAHKNMPKLSAEQRLADLQTFADRVAADGVDVSWFRPPYGSYNGALVDSAKDFGWHTVLWTVDPEDWKSPGAAVIADRVIKSLHPGAVVLLHSNKAQTVAALPDIIRRGRDLGYRFVTMSDWLAAVRSVPLENVQVAAEATAG